MALVSVKYLRGKSGKEIHENLCEACGNNALSFKTVYRYLARFSAGKLTFRRKLAVKGVLDEDRRLTYDEVAESVGISHGSAHEIITRHLKMSRIAP